MVIEMDILKIKLSAHSNSTRYKPQSELQQKQKNKF
jgi:hypothetical protein